MHLIQEDLHKVALEWNTHRIRPARGSTVPSGHPDVLFYMPELHGKFEDYIIHHQTLNPYRHTRLHL